MTRMDAPARLTLGVLIGRHKVKVASLTRFAKREVGSGSKHVEARTVRALLDVVVDALRLNAR
jgi:hypothetical protein